MNSKNKLKKLLIDIIIPVVIFALIGCALYIEQQGFRLPSNADESLLIDEDAWYAVQNPNAGAIASNAPKCLIVFDKNDDDSIALKNNIEYVLNSINVSTKTQEIEVPKEIIEDEEEMVLLQNTSATNTDRETYDFTKYDDIIFCLSNLTYLGVDYNAFSQWISSGGHAMFAMGIDPSDGFYQWKELLGISNQTIPELVEADSLRFKTSIMAGVEEREFSDDVINCQVLDLKTTDDCIVHISTCDEIEVPLLWEKNFDNGKIIICNAEMFESKSDRGIFTAAYCEFYPAYVYPVINSAVYCIDDCPAPAPAGYDNNVLSQYGYTVTDFITNVWMPAMQKISEEYGIKFTSFVIQSYENNVDGPFTNKDNIKTAKYYASLILNTGGEIGIHGYNHQPLVLEGFAYDKENSGYVVWPSIKKMLESIDAVTKYTESLADDLYVQAYIAPSNVISTEALQALQSQFEDLRVYAGVYVGTPDQMVQEFTVLENGTVYCPRLTADMQMEDSEWWLQINELNYHYVESNFIHPDDILDEERSDGGDFSQMLLGYKEMIEWNQRYGLVTSTISECGAAVQRYCNLNYIQTLEGNNMNIEVDGLIDTAYMMLRLNGKKPISMSGGSYTKLSENVYVLKIDKKSVNIKLVDQ